MQENFGIRMKIKERRKAPVFKLDSTDGTEFNFKKKKKLLFFFILKMILLVALLKQEISQNYIKNSKEKNVKLLVYLKTVSKAI